MRNAVGYCISALLAGCISMPEHTNPYDPETINAAPVALQMSPDSAIVSATQNSVDLQWPMAADADEDDFEAYVILRRQAGIGDFLEIDRVTSFAKTNSSDMRLEPNTEYEYAISVEDKGGLRSLPLVVKVRTAPIFVLFGKIPLYVTSVTSATINPIWKFTGQDTVTTLYYLGKNGGGKPLVGLMKITKNATGPATASNTFFVDNFPTDSVVERRIYPDYSPLENSFFRTLMKDVNPVLYDTMTNPIGTALKNNQIFTRNLSYSSIAEKSDTIFVGVTYFVTVAMQGNQVRQCGLCGVLVYKPASATSMDYMLDRFVELPVAHTTLRDDHFVRVALPSSVNQTIFVAAYLSGWEGLVEWNPVTAQKTLLKTLRPDNMVGFQLRHVVGQGGEILFASSGNVIFDPADPAKAAKVPLNLFSDISDFCVDQERNLYVEDRSMSGIMVVDHSGAPVSKWTRLGMGAMTLSASDFIICTGTTVIFSVDTRSLWRTIP